jgi:hypothetical protein
MDLTESRGVEVCVFLSSAGVDTLLLDFRVLRASDAFDCRLLLPNLVGWMCPLSGSPSSLEYSSLLNGGASTGTSLSLPSFLGKDDKRGSTLALVLSPTRLEFQVILAGISQWRNEHAIAANRISNVCIKPSLLYLESRSSLQV